MTKLRKEDSSLYYYIKDIVLKDYIEFEQKAELMYLDSVSSPLDNSYVYEALVEFTPKPSDRGRGLVYFDDTDLNCLVSTTTYSGTPEQKNRVVVYSTTSSGTLEVVPRSEYIIDYIDARIITSGTIEPTHIDFYWNYISIVDEWAAIEAASPPVVVIDIHGTDKKGYQLGGGKKDIRKVDIHIFASSTAERNDLVDKIYNAFYNKSIPVYDFPKGSVLDYDGTFYGIKDAVDRDSLYFDRTTISGVSNLYFDNVTSRHISLPLIMTRGVNEVMLSDLNAYRAKISFAMYSYNDRYDI